MLCFVVRRAISLAAAGSQHHGQLLLFSIQRDSGWFQHHGQLPTLYYYGSWSELILAGSLESLPAHPCPLRSTRLILCYLKLHTPSIQKAKKKHPDKKQNDNTVSQRLPLYSKLVNLKQEDN